MSVLRRYGGTFARSSKLELLFLLLLCAILTRADGVYCFNPQSSGLNGRIVLASGQNVAKTDAPDALSAIIFRIEIELEERQIRIMSKHERWARDQDLKMRRKNSPRPRVTIYAGAMIWSDPRPGCLLMSQDEQLFTWAYFEIAFSKLSRLVRASSCKREGLRRGISVVVRLRSEVRSSFLSFEMRNACN
jgi:hypothetical protein